MEFLTSVINSIPIVGVDHKNDALGVGVVMPPELSDFILTSYIPNVERDVLVRHFFHVEANGWDWCHDLSELELV